MLVLFYLISVGAIISAPFLISADITDVYRNGMIFRGFSGISKFEHLLQIVTNLREFIHFLSEDMEKLRQRILYRIMLNIRAQKAGRSRFRYF